MKYLTSTLSAAALLFVLAAPALQADAPASNDGTNAVLWMNTSVEYQTSTRAVYKAAELQLAARLAEPGETAAPEQTGDFAAKPPAVILDIDETVLDNSAYQAWAIRNGVSYSSKSWGQFMNDAISTPIPGALEFTKAAAARGVTVFYVSNRRATAKAATVQNLKAYGFPFTDGVDTVLLRGEQPDWTGDKGTRRALIAKNYRIIMLLGDNFGDFVDDMGGDIVGRDAMMAKYDSYWSERWFTLPNPAYGSWLSATFPPGKHLSDAEKHQAMLDGLRPWAGPKE